MQKFLMITFLALFCCSEGLIFAEFAGLPQGASVKKPHRAATRAEMPKAVFDWSPSMYQFSFHWLKMLSEKEEKTQILSPLMIYDSLLFLAEGSRAETQKQLLDALPSEKKEAMNMEDWQAFLYPIQNTFQLYSIPMATKLWIDKEYPLHDHFQNKINLIDGKEVESLDFSKSASNKVIQKWLNTQIKKSRPLLFQKISLREHKMLLVGLFDFHAAWKYPFLPSKTRRKDFFCLDGTVEKLPMMTQLAPFGFYKDNLLQAVFLPFQQKKEEDGKIADFEYILLIPQERTGLSEIKKRLDISYWKKIDRERREEVLDFSMPKFILKETDSLKETWKTLGIRDAFDEFSADFSGMSREKVFLSNVRNDILFDVSEKGVDATVILSTWMGGSIPKSIHADHPFVFILREISSDVPLYVGQFTGLKDAVKPKGDKKRTIESKTP